MNILYTAEATATGGRGGHSRSSDGVLDLNLSVPPAMGGTGEATGTNPEQLFAAGYAACFNGAMAVAAQRLQVSVEGREVTAKVSIGRSDEGSFGLAVELLVKIPGLEREKAVELVEMTHHICPYSNATRGNVDVKLIVV